jgi:hypothetical protein
MSTTQPPTEEEINEWRRKSREEGICGIVDCSVKPSTVCKKCTNHYCSEHFPHHLDLLPDGDPNYSSSNEGLDEYMDGSDDFNSDEETDID